MGKGCLLIALAAILLCSGCFDLETEILFFEDGSGIVTQWVRMDYADVAAAAAMNRTFVPNWAEEIKLGVDAAFEEAEGIRLLDRLIFDEAEKITLRYRFGFDNARDLNAFLNDERLFDQWIYPAKGRFTFQPRPASCGGTYQVGFSFAPRREEDLAYFHFSPIDDLAASDKEPIIRKFYSGEMKLRLVLPGKIDAHDAAYADGRGFPIYQTTVLDFFRQGIKGAARSTVLCEQGQVKKEKPGRDAITYGDIPTASQLWQVARTLPHSLDILYEFECDRRDRVKIAATFLVDEPLRGPFEFYFPFLLFAFPQIESGYEMKLDQVGPHLYRYRFEIKKPVRLSKLGSKFIYYGRQKAHYSFRMNLPQMAFGEPAAPGQAATTVLRVKVTLPDAIRMTNASEKNEKVAFWTITDRMMQENRITLEALTE